MKSSAYIRKNFRLAALASVVAIGAFGASNSFAADATTNVDSTVIAPIEISKVADLNFGQFAPVTGGGDVTVSTNGTRSTTGPILSTTGATPAAAQFDVTGAADATYSIAWSGATELTGPAESTAMALTRISDLDASGTTSGEVAGAQAGTLTSGAQSIYLGGTLAVAEVQAAGLYEGDVVVTVEYD